MKIELIKAKHTLMVLMILISSSCSFSNEKNDANKLCNLSDLNKIELNGNVMQVQQDLYLLKDTTEELSEANKIDHLSRNENFDLFLDLLLFIFSPYQFRIDQEGNLLEGKLAKYHVINTFKDNIKSGEAWFEDRSNLVFSRYDEKGRLITRTPRIDSVWVIDRQINYRYNEGVLSHITDSDKRVRLKYDKSGRIAGVKFDSIKNDYEDVWLIEYDKYGNISKLISNEEDTILFTYDAYDNMKNWTKRTIKIGNKGIVVAVRKIQYYNYHDI